MPRQTAGPRDRAAARPLVAVSLIAVIAVLALVWWRLPAGRRMRARALVAATPAWIGQATLSGPGWTLPLTVHWQRPGWWRIESPGAESAYDGRTLSVRLPGSPAAATSAALDTAPWQVLWPDAALGRSAPVQLDARGWPVDWWAGGLHVHYSRVTPVPLLPRADFRVTGASAPGARALPPSLTPGRLPFAPRPVPGIRPLWTAAYNLPGEGPVAVFAYALDAAGPLTIAERPGTCASGNPTWVRTQDGWIVHWCAGVLQFTGQGPDDRPAIARIVRALS